MRHTLAALFALFALPAFAAEPALPEGAVARLGTTTFRTSGGALCLSPDGTRAAVRVGNGIDVLNLDTGEVVASMRDEKRLPDVIIGRDSFRLTFAFASGGKEVASSAFTSGTRRTASFSAPSRGRTAATANPRTCPKFTTASSPTS